jgi:hypothetical protein
LHQVLDVGVGEVYVIFVRRGALALFATFGASWSKVKNEKCLLVLPINNIIYKILALLDPI